MMDTTNWTNPELLADADTWSAYQTVMAILAGRGQTPSGAAIVAEAELARSWALAQPNHVADRWGTAYARLIKAVRQ